MLKLKALFFLFFILLFQFSSVYSYCIGNRGTTCKNSEENYEQDEEEKNVEINIYSVDEGIYTRPEQENRERKEFTLYSKPQEYILSIQVGFDIAYSQEFQQFSFNGENRNYGLEYVLNESLLLKAQYLEYYFKKDDVENTIDHQILYILYRYSTVEKYEIKVGAGLGAAYHSSSEEDSEELGASTFALHASLDKHWSENTRVLYGLQVQSIYGRNTERDFSFRTHSGGFHIGYTF